MRERLNNHAGVLALAALVVSILGAGVLGAQAAGVKITSADIKNGSITTKDLRNSGIRSVDLKNGTVSSADIGNGDVQPIDVEMPAPEASQNSASVTINPTMAFAKVGDFQAFTKDDPSSVVRVDWTGTVEGHNGGEASGCVFQLRIDGAAPPSGGEVFAVGLSSVSASALFANLPSGPHTVEVWARLAIQEPTMGGQFDSCTVGPAAAPVPQSFVVTEEVV